MRFLPNIRYGTEGYPEKVARRLRTLNVTTWTTAAAVTSAAVAHFLDPTPGLWKLASVDSIGGAIFASVPLLHRFGISAALTFIIVADTYFFALIYLIGTGVGVQSSCEGRPAKFARFIRRRARRLGVDVYLHSNP